MHGRPRKAPTEEEQEASSLKAAKLRDLQSEVLHFHQNKMYVIFFFSLFLLILIYRRVMLFGNRLFFFFSVRVWDWGLFAPIFVADTRRKQ